MAEIRWIFTLKFCSVPAGSSSNLLTEIPYSPQIDLTSSIQEWYSLHRTSMSLFSDLKIICMYLYMTYMYRVCSTRHFSALLWAKKKNGNSCIEISIAHFAVELWEMSKNHKLILHKFYISQCTGLNLVWLIWYVYVWEITTLII